GFGALPSKLALALATSATSWMRRLVAHPINGHLVAADPGRRRFGKPLRDFLDWTYHGCAVANCDSAERHIDHVIDYARGGATSIGNGQPLCERHNYDKLHPAISVTRDPDGTIYWTLPSGRTYETRPPPALGPGSGDPPF
ncbi:MAG: HNH endonuclease, partial [Nocardioidaceae bacterium]